LTPAAPGAFHSAVDDERWVITYFGHMLPLSRTEFLLLKTLVHRPGRIYTRDELMEMLWDEPLSALRRTVDAHIKSLRAKLKDINADLDPIHTFRGVATP